MHANDAMPIVHPPIYTRCCKRILGCQTCVDRWYCGTDGINHNYPICCSERAFTETSQIKWLDDFLNSIRAVFDGESDTVIDRMMVNLLTEIICDYL